MTEIGETGPSRDVRTIGEEPKPRALLSWEGPNGDRVAEVLALHAPTVRPIRELAGVRQDDYDLLVTNRMNALTDYGSNKFEPESRAVRHLFRRGRAGELGHCRCHPGSAFPADPVALGIPLEVGRRAQRPAFRGSGPGA